MHSLFINQKEKKNYQMQVKLFIRIKSQKQRKVQFSLSFWPFERPRDQLTGSLYYFVYIRYFRSI